MNQVTVLFFATLKDRAGVQAASLELPDGAVVGELKAALEQRFPALGAALPSVVVSVNREFAFDDELLPAGAEVALFPPVSGGACP
jgi:molybdopterin converting factor subunit 1